MKLFQTFDKLKRIDLINNIIRIYTESEDIIDIPLSSSQLKQAYKLLMSVELDSKQIDSITGKNN